jgi:hypothetical protein
MRLKISNRSSKVASIKETLMAFKECHHHQLKKLQRMISVDRGATAIRMLAGNCTTHSLEDMSQ